MADLPDILARILEARGIGAADLEAYLNPSLKDLPPATDLPGIAEAAEAILCALASGRRVVVFGDYDCDGICSTAILVKTFAALGATAEPFIPDRLTEGYGMSDASVARLLREFPDVGLVVTVDNGINSISQIAALKEKGVTVVVTDHHLPSPDPARPGAILLPPADATVDPKVAAPQALAGLCGAGVAYFLAQKLVGLARARRGEPDLARGLSGELIVLAGLATVTDIMPLLGVNRILVSSALRHFGAWAPLGLRELHQRAARTGFDALISKDFGYALGPRINAAGRLSNAMEALELILSDDREIARELARIIDVHNTERKTIEQQMTDEAMAKIVWLDGAKTVPEVAQMLDLPTGHPGVAGIVAARIMERLGGTVPVCVLAGGRGSARAPEGLNIRDAFEACSDLLTAYGGHAAAGGFAVKEGMTEAFRRRLCDYCREFVRTHGPFTSSKSGDVEAWVMPADLTLELAEAVRRLEPFGEGNPEPIMGLRGVAVADMRPLGSDGRHLAVRFRGDCPRGVWWGAGEHVEELRAKVAPSYDVRFVPIVSDYGERHVELRILSLTPSDFAFHVNASAENA